MSGTMRVVARMGLGFSAVMILLLLVSAVSLARLRTMNEDVQSIIDSRHPKIMLANEAAKLTIDNGRQLRSMLLADSGRERETFRANVENNRPRIDAALAALGERIQTDAGRALLADIVAKESVLAPKYQQLYALAGTDPQRATTYLITDFYAANNAFWAALDAMSSYQSDEMAREGRATNAAFIATRRLVLVLALTAVAIGMVIACWITVTVARRLEQDKRRQESRTAQLSDRLAVSEAELQDSATTLTLAADAASLGFWTRDLAHDTFWASPHWRALFGFSASEPVDGDAILQRVHADDRACVARGFGLAPDAQGGNETVFRVEPGGGQIRWVSSHGRVEFGADGKPLAIRGVSLDITAQKQAELDVAQKRKEVTYLARVAMLGELSGAMAHELNQPLTSILINAGAAHLFLTQRDDPELGVLRDIMQDIMEEDRRAGDIIKRLRGLFGKDEIVRQALAVNDLVADVARVLRNDLINHSVTLRVELAQDLPAVMADRVQLQQVLINLVLNACDAMDGLAPSKREVTVSTARSGEDAVQVTVADQGTGIASGALEKIFESFYTTKERGMGLGLSICRNIVSANGGRLWAENHAGPGASFHFNLPGHVLQS